MPGFSRKRESKHLICAHCDALIAVAAYRPLLSWRLDITSNEGYQIAPLALSVQLRIAEQQLADASPAEEDQARWRVGFIGRQLPEVFYDLPCWRGHSRVLPEVIYDLPCPRGHRTLVTEPQIAWAVRRARGEWVILNEAH